MSSTLFGRGTNTQVGGRKRAEDQERAVLSIRTAVDELKAATAADFRQQTTRIAALEATIAALQKTAAATAATVATLSAATATATAAADAPAS